MELAHPKRNTPVGTSITVGVLTALTLFLVPGLLSSQNPLEGVEPLEELTPVVSLPLGEKGMAVWSAPSPVVGADASRTVELLRQDGTAQSLSLEDYLWGVVSAEMPASFPLEALKAQAVAARTYTAERLLQGTKHEKGQVCDDSGCCQAYLDREERMALWGEEAVAAEYDEKIKTAIAQTDGLYVLYQGEPIDAVFFSSASGQTVDAQEVWGAETPYLVGVDSPEGEEVPNYHTQVVLPLEEVRSLVEQTYPKADLGGNPETWFTQLVENSAGGVGQMALGGVTLTGGQLRTLFSLRSPSFTVAYQEETFVFSVTGYGHGVGMSQYGAKTLADQGKHFQEILTWYYTDTQVVPFSWE